MPAIALRDDYDAVGVRGFATRSQDAKQARRLLSIAAAYEGIDRFAAIDKSRRIDGGMGMGAQDGAYLGEAPDRPGLVFSEQHRACAVWPDTNRP